MCADHKRSTQTWYIDSTSAVRWSWFERGFHIWYGNGSEWGVVVLLLKWSSYWSGLLIEVVLLLKWSSYWSGPLIEVVLLPKWSYYWSGPLIEVVLLPKWSYYWSGPLIEVVLLLKWSSYWSGPLTKVVLLLKWSSYWSGPLIKVVLIQMYIHWYTVQKWSKSGGSGLVSEVFLAQDSTVHLTIYIPSQTFHPMKCAMTKWHSSPRTHHYQLFRSQLTAPIHTWSVRTHFPAVWTIRFCLGSYGCKSM